MIFNFMITISHWSFCLCLGCQRTSVKSFSKTKKCIFIESKKLIIEQATKHRAKIVKIKYNGRQVAGIIVYAMRESDNLKIQIQGIFAAFFLFLVDFELK